MAVSILTMTRGDEQRLPDWLRYHAGIGFNRFIMLLDNPVDASHERIDAFRLERPDVEVITHVLEPTGEYFDGLPPDERWRAVRKWKQDNQGMISAAGLPINDPLSWRQYQHFPDYLDRESSLNPDGWVALIDVDEYIAIPSFTHINALIASTSKPRIRFLNFNFDMSDWDGRSVPRAHHTQRWRREDIVAHGHGWENRVKSLVRTSSATPLVSVHAISKGPFTTADPGQARLHHYRYPNQNLPIPYSMEDATLKSRLILPDEV